MSLRDQILAKPTRKQRTISIPEWECDVVVMELDTDQRVAFLGSIDINDPRAELAPLLPYLPELVLDPESNKPVFEAADLDTLKRDHPGVLMRLMLEAVDVSELGEAELEAAEGNS